jgi:hypothetical protein
MSIGGLAFETHVAGLVEFLCNTHNSSWQRQLIGVKMRRILHSLFIVAAAGLVVSLTGCGGFGAQRVPLTGATLEGKVTYGTEKVPVGLIIAVGASGTSQANLTDEGTYKMENAPLGEVTLMVNVKAGEGALMSRRMSGDKNIPNVVHVPTKYSDPATSGIKTTIAKGENIYNIEITK